VKDNAIDIIVNCAAYTNVDKAEIDEDVAHKINSLAVENLGLSGARVIHISTDYVFSGEACVPYAETDSVAPRTAYGRTKREGEVLLQAVSPKSIIIRTAWLYSTYGNNFVKTMLRLGKEREALGVVADQTGTPTYARDLAMAIIEILRQGIIPGVYHYSNEGTTSWYDFTKAIHRIAGINTCSVKPIHTEDYPTPAKRPHYSVLDKTKIKSSFNISIPWWEDSLKECLKELN
jgi:dTDP-4-dehydrorhamnose reductase